MKPEYQWLSEYDKPKYWSTFSPIYFQTIPFLFGFYFNLNDNKLRNFLKKQKGKTLDLGCGNGRFLDYADIGVDFSREMLKRAKRTKKQVILASILNLPFKDKSVAAFGSYGWNGKSLPLLNEELGKTKMQVVNEGIKVKWNLDDETQKECMDFGREFAKGIK